MVNKGVGSENRLPEVAEVVEDHSDEDEVEVVRKKRVRRYTRARLVQLGNLPVCLRFPNQCPALQDPQLAALLFPAVIAASSADQRQDRVNASGAGQRSILDCLLDKALENLGDGQMEDLLLNLVKTVEISQDEEKVMQELCATLKSILVTHFPNAVLEPFGSIPSNLGLKGSDLDLYMNLGEESKDENSNVKAGTWEVKHKTKQVANILYADSSERFRSAQPVVRAKIPIVRVKDRITGIRCDLNTCTRMGVINSAWVRFCADVHPTIRNLLILVKVFSMRQGLTGSGRGDHLTSYCLTVMVIFFLQTKGILHPVTVLQDVSDLPELQISGYNFCVCKDQALLPPLQQSCIPPLSSLLRDFFLYFAEFTFGSKAVCPLVGEPILLFSLRNGTFLHPRLEGCATGKSKDRLKTEKVMVVQDPFELKRNIAGNVSPSRLSRVVRTFEASAKLLEEMEVEGGDSKARNDLARLLSRDLVPQSEGTPADQESDTSYHRTKDEDAEEPEFV